MLGKLIGCLGIVVAILALGASCSSSEASDSLSREKALELLKKHSNEILHPDVWYFGSIIFVSDATRPIPTATSDLMAFCDSLVARGLLKREASLDTTVSPGLGGTYKYYHYGIVDQPGLRVGDQGNEILVPWFTIDSLTFLRITGIRTHEDTAIVDVDVQRSPSAIYAKLTSAYMATCLRLHKVLQLPVPLVQGNFFNQPASLKFTFTRYDDGWRLGN